MGKKRIFADVQPTGASIPDLALVARNEPEAFMRKTQDLIDSGKLSWSSIRSSSDLYRALAPVAVKAEMVDNTNQVRAIQASAFPLLAGALTVAQVNEGYEKVPTVGQDLVEEMNDPNPVAYIAQIMSNDSTVDRVSEAKDFPEIGASEEMYHVNNKRNGRLVSITQEAIERNQLGDIVRRANALGEIAAELIEEQTLRRVCDIDGSGSSAAEPYVMHRNGAGASLYSSTANTPSVRTPVGTRILNNALVDYTNLEKARLVLAGMLNSRLKRIAIPMSECIVLVPDALIGTLLKIMGSEYTPGVFNELNTWGPRGAFRPQYRSTPKLDDLSTTAWYIGSFKKQFVRKWSIKMEYVQLDSDPATYLRNRIAFQARLAWDCEVGVVDHIYVVQNLSATTAP